MDSIQRGIETVQTNRQTYKQKQRITKVEKVHIGMSGTRLFLILLFGGLNGHPAVLRLYRRSGDAVNLPCNNTLPDDRDCKSTTWSFVHNHSIVSVAVAEFGEIKHEANPFKTNRISLESNCSLSVKDIRTDDAGCYTCQQFKGEIKHGGDQLIYLSVLNITRGDNGTTGQTLTCTLFEYFRSCAKLSWINADNNLMKDNSQESGCTSTLTIDDHDATKPYRCEVTVGGEPMTFIDFPGDMKTQGNRGKLSLALCYNLGWAINQI